MDLIELASALFGRSRAESASVMPDATVRMVTASGAVDSTDGSAGVLMDCDITPAENAEGDESILDVPTSPSVKSGDDVLVGLVGTGVMKTPVVIANPGFGDRIQTQMDVTEELVERAEEAARATSQHFWSDDNGAHVTQVTQDDWAESQSGPNALWNTFGMLFRDGLTNLLAVLTNGLAIYDGAGNAASNILATFTATGTRIGREAGQHIVIGSGSIDMLSGERPIFTLEGTESVVEETGVTTTYDTSLMAVGGGDYSTGSFGIVREDQHVTSGTEHHEYFTTVGMGIDSDNDSEDDLYFRLVDGSPSTAYLKAPYMVLYDRSGQMHLYDMNDVIDVLDGGGAVSGVTGIKGNAESSYRTGNVNLTPANLGIGTVVTSNPAAVSVATSAATTLGGITVPAGTWVFAISTTFAASNTGRRVVYFSNSATESTVSVAHMGDLVTAPANGGMTKFSSSAILSPTAQTTYYCRCWQNSGSTLNCQCYIRAVRIA